MEKSNISVILPVHELNEQTQKLFSNAVNSVKDQIVRPEELIIVVPAGSEVASFVKSFDYGDYKASVIIAENDGKSDFSSQVNFGVSKTNTEWFSILEFDDEYAKIWFKNVVEYRKAHTDVELFMPIIIDVDQNNQFIGFMNEAVWAQSFCEVMGVLDQQSLLTYQNFNIDGMVIKKSAYIAHGGFKSNIKLTFIYEFLLRMTFKAVKTMIIPKFGYKHMNQRPGSLFASYKETLDPAEARWWLSTAKKESYFAKDRELSYQPTNG
jgi:hypothetical protein